MYATGYTMDHLTTATFSFFLCSYLRALQLRGLSGTIPDDLWNATSLIDLYVSHNETK